MNTKKGFTLIELLVVVSIIALLVSILLPALGKAREQAQNVVCMTNMKQLGMATVLWSQEHDGWFPPGAWSQPDPMPIKDTQGNITGWQDNPGSLQRYTSTSRQVKGNLYACPTAAKVKFLSTNQITGFDNTSQQCTYSINGWLAINHDCSSAAASRRSPGKAPSGPTTNSVFYDGTESLYWTKRGTCKVDQIRIPNETAIFAECEYYAVTDWSFNPFKRATELTYASEARWHDRRPADAYGYGKGNIAWADGRVSREPTDFTKTESDGKRRWWYYFWNH